MEKEILMMMTVMQKIVTKRRGTRRVINMERLVDPDIWTNLKEMQTD